MHKFKEVKTCMSVRIARKSLGRAERTKEQMKISTDVEKETWESSDTTISHLGK